MSATVDLTPTWGEWGNIYRRFAESGETKAIRHLSEDFARAMASTEAVNKLLRTFTDEQRIIYEKTMVEEMRKQGFHA